MATRSIVIVREDLKDTAVYVHWDGYPKGVGAAVLAALNEQYSYARGSREDRWLAACNGFRAHFVTPHETEGYWSSFPGVNGPAGEWMTGNGGLCGGCEYLYRIDVSRHRVELYHAKAAGVDSDLRAWDKYASGYTNCHSYGWRLVEVAELPLEAVDTMRGIRLQDAWQSYK